MKWKINEIECEGNADELVRVVSLMNNGVVTKPTGLHVDNTHKPNLPDGVNTRLLDLICSSGRSGIRVWDILARLGMPVTDSNYEKLEQDIEKLCKHKLVYRFGKYVVSADVSQKDFTKKRSRWRHTRKLKATTILKCTKVLERLHSRARLLRDKEGNRISWRQAIALASKQLRDERLLTDGCEQK